jgi:hypothetical protein
MSNIEFVEYPLLQDAIVNFVWSTVVYPPAIERIAFGGVSMKLRFGKELELEKPVKR